MITNRTKERILVLLSGWYSYDYQHGKIRWNHDDLMIANQDIVDDVIYNLEHELGYHFDSSKTDAPEFQGWARLTIGLNGND